MSFLKVFTSRTVWTVIALAAINATPQILASIPPQLRVLADILLGALAIYFRANPQAQLGTDKPVPQPKPAS